MVPFSVLFYVQKRYLKDIISYFEIVILCKKIIKIKFYCHVRK
jgi:hypothetical protein